MATFGNTATGANTDYAFANDAIILGKYTLSVAGIVSKLTSYLSGSENYAKGVVFDDNGASGKPGTLIAVTPGVALPSSVAWTDFVFASGVSLAAGEWWIGVVAKYGVGALCSSATSGGAAGYETGSYDSPADLTSWQGESTYMQCTYATYTTASGLLIPLLNHLLLGD